MLLSEFLRKERGDILNLYAWLDEAADQAEEMEAALTKIKAVVTMLPPDLRGGGMIEVEELVSKVLKDEA